MNPRELATLAHFKYPTHYAYVYQYSEGGRIHCLKYSKKGIVWEYFEYSEWDQCKEYMLSDLPDHTYGFEEDPE
jgi:hypothetical protein